jgi:hypothetical protein
MQRRSSRLAAAAVTAVIAAIGALAAGAAASPAQPQTAAPARDDQAVHAAHAAHAVHAATGSISAQELALRNEMRRLWEDHVTWTRLAVISLTTGSPDTDATVARLLRNQADIGNAIKPFYGRKAGNRLTALLRDHILIAADLIAAAKAGDDAGVARESARWDANARQIARFLHRANPRHWPRRVLLAMLRQHLRLTTLEVVARLQGDWEADVAAYDRIHRHALMMADALSTGIVAQFPARFR